jgi:hypothetical protein
MDLRSHAVCLKHQMGASAETSQNHLLGALPPAEAQRVIENGALAEIAVSPAHSARRARNVSMGVRHICLRV